MLKRDSRAGSIGWMPIVSFCVILAMGLVSFGILLASFRNYENANLAVVAKIDQAVNFTAEAGRASSVMAYQTLRYTNNPNPATMQAKMDADERAGSQFASAKKIIDSLPNNTELVAALEASQAHDADVCNPLENQVIELARTGQVQQARRVFETKYVPVQAKLSALIADFQKQVVNYQTKYKAEIERQASVTVALATSLEVLSLVLSIALGGLIARQLLTPIRAVAARMEAISQECLAGLHRTMTALSTGDLTHSEPIVMEPLPITKTDGISQMAVSCNHLLAQVKEISSAYEIARKNMSHLVGSTNQSSMAAVAKGEELSVALCRFVGAAENIEHRSREVREATDEISVASRQLAHGSENLASVAITANTTMESLESAVQRVKLGSQEQQSAAQQAGEVSRQSRAALHEIIQSISRIQRQVEVSVGAVQELDARQSQIGNIVETINQIAEQTNLLALNAAIEAARAGDQGRGFAVVADEVRKLAERSSEATREIGTLIEGVRSGVAEAINAMEVSSREVTAGSAASEQAEVAIRNIETGIAEMDAVASANQLLVDDAVSNTQLLGASLASVAAISQETAATAQELSATSEHVANAAESVSEELFTQKSSIRDLEDVSVSLRNTSDDVLKRISEFQYEAIAEPFLRAA